MYFTTPGATVISIFSSFFLNSFLKNKRFGRCVLSESIDIVFSLGNMKAAATDGTGVSLQVVAAALALSFPDVFLSLTEARITGLAFSHDPFESLCVCTPVIIFFHGKPLNQSMASTVINLPRWMNFPARHITEGKSRLAVPIRRTYPS